MFCKYVLWLCLEFDEISVGRTVKMHYLSFTAPKMSSSHKLPHTTGSSTWMRSSGSFRIGPRGHTPFHNLLVLGVSLPLEWSQHAVMHPQYGCTTSMCNIQHAQRKDEVHRLAHKRVSLHDALLEKTLKLRNKCKRQMEEPLPTCQGALKYVASDINNVHRFGNNNQQLLLFLVFASELCPQSLGQAKYIYSFASATSSI